jgi:hypothetical protein
MRRKSTREEVQGLSDDLCDHRRTSAPVDADVRHHVALETYVAGAGVTWVYRLEPKCGEQREAAAPLLPSQTNPGQRSPWTNNPGIFTSRRGGLEAVPTVNKLSRRRELRSKEDVAQYHDSELGDVYDLYNACNGTMRGGLLDDRRLNELTAAEREALDVERLREVWEHTASGCQTCAEIVNTLNEARGMMRGNTGTPPLIEPRPSTPDVPDHAEEKALGQSG